MTLRTTIIGQFNEVQFCTNLDASCDDFHLRLRFCCESTQQKGFVASSEIAHFEVEGGERGHIGFGGAMSIVFFNHKNAFFRSFKSNQTLSVKGQCVTASADASGLSADNDGNRREHLKQNTMICENLHMI